MAVPDAERRSRRPPPSFGDRSSDARVTAQRRADERPGTSVTPRSRHRPPARQPRRSPPPFVAVTVAAVGRVGAPAGGLRSPRSRRERRCSMIAVRAPMVRVPCLRWTRHRPGALPRMRVRSHGRPCDRSCRCVLPLSGPDREVPLGVDRAARASVSATTSLLLTVELSILIVVPPLAWIAPRERAPRRSSGRRSRPGPEGRSRCRCRTRRRSARRLLPEMVAAPAPTLETVRSWVTVSSPLVSG